MILLLYVYIRPVTEIYIYIYCTIIAIDFFATIERCGIVTAMYRRSMMIYSSPRLNLRGPSVTVVSIGMEHLSLMTSLIMFLNRLTKRSRYLGGCNMKLDSTCQVLVLHREQDFCNFCCNPSKIKFCMEEVSVGEIYNTLLDSNEGGLPPHTSQTKNVSKTNENKMSDKEAPIGYVVEHWNLGLFMPKGCLCSFIRSGGCNWLNIRVSADVTSLFLSGKNSEGCLVIKYCRTLDNIIQTTWIVQPTIIYIQCVRKGGIHTTRYIDWKGWFAYPFTLKTPCYWLNFNIAWLHNIINCLDIM